MSISAGRQSSWSSLTDARPRKYLCNSIARSCSSSSLVSDGGELLLNDDASRPPALNVSVTRPSAAIQQLYHEQMQAGVGHASKGKGADGGPYSSTRTGLNMLPITADMSIDRIRDIVAGTVPLKQPQVKQTSASVQKDRGTSELESLEDDAPSQENSRETICSSPCLHSNNSDNNMSSTESGGSTCTRVVRFMEKLRLGKTGPVLTVVSPNKSRADRCILYIPGGAFCCAAHAGDLCTVERLATLSKSTVFMVHHRLAPEHPFPSALFDCVYAYLYLVGRRKQRSSLKRKAENIFSASKLTVVGSSSGGGLLFSLLLKLQQMNEALPAAAVALSPWVDLSINDASHENASKDPILSTDILKKFADLYCGTTTDCRKNETARCSELLSKYEQEKHQRVQPYVSPLYGDFYSAFPSTLIHVGQNEILLDDAKQLATKLALVSKNTVKLKLFAYATHGFQGLYPDLPESIESIADIVSFIDQVVYEKEMQQAILLNS